MVLALMDELVKVRDKLRVANCREAALKGGELHPIAVAVHCLEHGPPPPSIADVVNHEVDALIRRHDTPSELPRTTLLAQPSVYDALTL